MTVQPEKVNFQLKLGQSRPIYEAFKAIREGSLWGTLTEAQQRIVEGTFALQKLFEAQARGGLKYYLLWLIFLAYVVVVPLALRCLCMFVVNG